MCKAFAEVIETICSIENQSASLEAFLACRLIPLDKNSGLRPIGIGEVLHRIACSDPTDVTISLSNRDSNISRITASLRRAGSWLRIHHTCNAGDI